MESIEKEAVKKASEYVLNHRLPRWNELPDLDIYMDQVISLISRYFEGYPGCDEKGLTSSMVNNYVKQGIIPAPVSKKYNKVHLAHLIIVCILKTVMPIGQVGQLIALKRAGGESYESLYNRFCDFFEKSESAVARSVEEFAAAQSDFSEIVLRTAIRAHAEQTVALGLMKSEFEET